MFFHISINGCSSKINEDVSCIKAAEHREKGESENKRMRVYKSFYSSTFYITTDLHTFIEKCLKTNLLPRCTE